MSLLLNSVGGQLYVDRIMHQEWRPCVNAVVY